MDVRLEESWKNVLSEEFGEAYFQSLIQFVRKEYENQRVYPNGSNIFRAFDSTPFEDVKVVILGQDPYHGPGQANGLSFSVNDGVRIPPSLNNIFKEIEANTGQRPRTSGDLNSWAKQGVLLLNATLTVRAHEAGSHQKKGWEEFTDAAIRELNKQKSGIVYMLWGSYAQKKGSFINGESNLILKSPHPSPLAAHRGFFGNRHFSKANDYLRRKGKTEIDW
ncbi:MAG TPA: uracil-DNA glycosylase [Cryomorphaceae bacterium]|nr:uracil-DNA glycosylase [Cryomorphaceae bacterium]